MSLPPGYDGGMTTPDGRTPHTDDPAEGREDPVEGRSSSDVESHPDGRGAHAEDPVEGPVSEPSPRNV
jgi:hypothetical protein